MKYFAAALALLAPTLPVRAAELLPVEQQVAAAVKSDKVTIVHFWATWCPNCKAELANGGWRDFVNTNPDVNFVFVTVRDPKPGTAELEKYGLGAQKNFTALQHPNPSNKKDDRIATFLEMPMWWVPTTWVYKDGQLRYALNYGEVNFAMLQQMVRDSAASWKH